MKLRITPKHELIPGRGYVGRGRTSNVALWDGEKFLTVGDEGGETVVKGEPYYEAEWGCFQPFLLVEESQMVEPTVLPKAQLISWRWYFGRGKTSNLARWDDAYFLAIAQGSGEGWVIREQYTEAEAGGFHPLRLVEEGRIAQPFGKHAWDAHYGSVLEI